MLNDSQLTQLQNLTDSAGSHLVLYKHNAPASVLASAGGWYLALKEKGVDVRLAALKKPKNKNLIGLKSTETDLGKQNLTISFDYNEEAVDKISYHIGETTKKFYLTIKPQKGHPPLNANTVEFSYTGFEAEIIYLFGIDKLEELDKLYFGYEEKFQETPLVAFHTQTPNYGTIKIVADQADLSQKVFSLLTRLVWPITPDAATDLLYGIESATDGLRSPTVTAETFEVVARLMKLGARRVWKEKTGYKSSHPTAKRSINKVSVKLKAK